MDATIKFMFALLYTRSSTKMANKRVAINKSKKLVEPELCRQIAKRFGLECMIRLKEKLVRETNWLLSIVIANCAARRQSQGMRKLSLVPTCVDHHVGLREGEFCYFISFTCITSFHVNYGL